jgi:hypothetical protein
MPQQYHGMIIRMRYLRGLSAFAAAVLSLTAFAQKSDTAPPVLTASEKTADLVGILPEVRRLRELSSSAGPVDRWQLLWLHQRISERAMAASLQVDATIAQIDNETSRANEVRGYLSDRRDRSVNRYNLLSVIVGGGLGATGSSMQFVSNLEKAGNAVDIAAGTVSAGLAVAGIHAQQGKTDRFDFESNMLAEFFDRPTLPDSRYPPTIWTFLNQSPLNGPPGVSRKELLLQNWVEVKRIDSLESKNKIDRVTSEPSQMLQLTIDDFEDRAAMLQDVRARISFLKRDLAELMASLPDAPKSTESDFKPGP